MDSIILPSLSNDIVLSIFKYLVDAELRKRINGSMDFRFGCQEGIIVGIGIMFGNADDLTSELSYERQETWLHMSERIVDEKLTVWADEMDNCTEGPDDIDFAQMIVDVSKAVDEFALEHPILLFDALKNL